MRILVLASLKGGSGKTTLAGHLAVQAQMTGAGPVALVDVDPHGTLGYWAGKRSSTQLVVVRANPARLVSELEVLHSKGIKLAVLDTPPAMTQVIQNALLPAGLVVIPTLAGPHDIRAAESTADLCERAGKSVVFVINGAMSGLADIIHDTAMLLSKHASVAPVMLHHCSDYVTSMDTGHTVTEIDPNVRSAKEIEALWSYIHDRLEKSFRRKVFSTSALSPQIGHGQIRSARSGFGRRNTDLQLGNIQPRLGNRK